ncbi:MAG TPA: LssY C-terminal domain-containing protein [Acetobacteraceae bacterium]|jgi:hypothetical protein|nr:LssY C-terminal domain-containing protein [Acetobacteraceae bacterium]
MNLLPPRLLDAFKMCLLLAIVSCATWRAPKDVSDAALRRRAVTEVRGDVRINAAVLSAVDTRRMLGGELDRTAVQPVWIEVENRTSRRLWLLRSGTDPDYYSPLEVAWSLHTLLGGDTNTQIDAHFDRLGFKNPIAAGETRAGILFINPERRTRLLNVDLLGRQMLIAFTLFLPVPDDAVGDDPALFRYSGAHSANYTDLAALRAAIEQLPCCATEAGGTTQGDPLNAVFVGDIPAIGSAMVRRDYRRSARAEDMAQQVFGRPPDFVLHKQAQAGAPSNWIRAWLAPISFQGQPVYLVQAGRPVGGRFASPGNSDIVLDEDVDEARNLLVQDMMYSGGLTRIGFVTGVGEASDTQPRDTLHGAHYYTNGLRAVLFFATRPQSLENVEFLRWEPYLDRRGQGDGNAGSDAGR